MRKITSAPKLPTQSAEDIEAARKVFTEKAAVKGTDDSETTKTEEKASKTMASETVEHPKGRRVLVQWNTRLPIDLVEKIDALNASSGIPRQRITEDAIRQYFEALRNK